MRKIIAVGLLAGAAAAAAGCSEGRAEDAGAAVSRTYDVGAFERIEVSGPYEVSVQTGKDASVSASGGERALERLIVEVEDGALKIHPKSRSGFTFGFSRDHPAHLTVTVPRLTGASIAGSGTIAVDRIAGDSFQATVAGSGDLRLGQVQLKQLKLGIAGSGEIRADGGRAGASDFEISGSGEINAARMISETAKVSIAGSGHVQANATGTASVDIAGSGDVELTGGAKCTVSKAGSGNVRCS